MSDLAKFVYKTILGRTYNADIIDWTWQVALRRQEKVYYSHKNFVSNTKTNDFKDI